MEELIKEKAKTVEKLKLEIGKVIVGQDYMVDRILVGIFTGGHVLLEGVPGLAKSLTVSTISKVLGTEFNRIQFTPDLLPADVIGTRMYNQPTGEFITKKGPIFSNIILADEINRAPAKVQSALLEAMQEKQVTIGEESYQLDRPFLVLATQNPLEQEGTYPLPEAQQDRFMLKLNVDYPKKDEEKIIIDRLTGEDRIEDTKLEALVSKKDIFEIRELVRKVYVSDELKNYVLDIVFKSREKSDYIECGASPRASINLILASKAIAFLNGRNYVIPDDVKEIAYDVLRHRLILTYEAEAEDLKVEDIIENILGSVNIP
ncbi:AAA family ATPase [Haliovirga abyssi]|uniref:ATPase n=1 Tax=Haliovirga abyssi TaxID=2996794 RepID=A0AAU9DDC7_9FUSO|nr:MoxR family ATPase [Haliovirga abyssi]BDU50327.1 ATPase [Haliovirga abyssi]